MDDDRIWEFEESLWIGDADHYQDLIDEACVMVLPTEPFVLSGEQAIAAVSNTPRWTQVTFTGCTVVRPQEGLIVIAYKAEATRDGGDGGYSAYCTTTLRRLAHEEWRVVQHQQTPPPTASA